jgi:hypothetical protein
MDYSRKDAGCKEQKRRMYDVRFTMQAEERR